MKLLIICHESFCCYAMRNLFERRKDFHVVDYAGNMDAALKSAEKNKPDMLLMCAHFLVTEGIECVPKIRRNSNQSKLVVFNSSFSGEHELLLVQEGVVGVFDHTVPPPSFVDANRRIYTGECWLRRELVSSLIHGAPAEPAEDCKIPLTDREKHIFSLIVAGYKNREIASRLFITEATVKTHINNIFKKLGIKNRKESILYAVRCNHILKPPPETG